ncbi:GIY-YIG nuclease family protein [Thioclava sp.]|uniref:GIY-YIG nuclease family protein n=1 Tax=Thioclava sp. TaxID=1933450 RepID=UPI003AA7C8F2
MTNSIDVTLPYVLLPGQDEPIYLPRRSRGTPPELWCDFPGAILPNWQAAAEAKGFTALRRIRDKQHVVLRCHACGKLTAQRSYTLLTAKLACAACPDQAKHALAKTAGMTFLSYDSENRHEGLFLLPCGHQEKRQFGFVEQVAAGQRQNHCDICFAAREEADANANGWSILGPDPEGNANYRLYLHRDGCGAVARVARSNFQTRRFQCPECGDGWTSAPSNVYAMRFRLEDGTPLVKLGFSRDPQSRLYHQLLSGSSAKGELLKVVAMPSGRIAKSREMSRHAIIKRALPHAIVPPECFARQIKVTSEIYAIEAEPLILSLLDELAQEFPGADGG